VAIQRNRELGGGGEIAGDDVSEIYVGLLPQLRARLLLLASGEDLCLLLYMAGDSVLQGVKEDLALAAQMPSLAQ
jgi:hypothetical protein